MSTSDPFLTLSRYNTTTYQEDLQSNGTCRRYRRIYERLQTIFKRKNGKEKVGPEINKLKINIYQTQ